MTILVPVLIAFAVATASSFLLTPLMIRLANRIGAIDHPDSRKAHSTPTPRLGGLAVAAAFAAGVTVLLALSPAEVTSWAAGIQGLVLALTLGGMLVLGVCDDLRPLAPSRKFAVQLLLSVVVYISGFKIAGVTSPFGDGMVTLMGFVDFLLTVLWIVGVTNALNLIDGLDGLASGVSVIAALSIVPIAFLNDDVTTAVLAAVLAGAIMGFLRYNFSPARIFLGDSGSLFLGFALAVLSVQSSTKSSTAFAIIVPVLALGVPIMDTLVAMLRRFLGHFSPGESPIAVLKAISTPDKAHIHHRLVSLGLSHRRAVIVLYVVSFVLGCGAFAVTVANNVISSAVLVVIGLATFIGVRQLHYREMSVLRNGMLLPLYDWHIVNSDSFKIFLDIVFILGASIGAHALAFPGEISDLTADQLVFALAIGTGVQLSILWLSNMYNKSLRDTGLADGLRIVRAVAMAVAATFAVSFALPQASLAYTVPSAILNFYFLLTLVLGSRLSFQVLSHFSSTVPREGKHVLIYGAGVDGQYLVKRLQAEETAVPLGFLDENPRLEGTVVLDLPVFGGHWRLARLCQTHRIDEIILAGNGIRPEVLRRIRLHATNSGILLRSLKVDISEVTTRAGAFPVEGNTSELPTESLPDGSASLKPLELLRKA